MTNNSNPNYIENKDVIIDVSVLYNVSGHDESFIQVMVETFLETIPEMLERMEQSLKNNDWENVYRSAHSAKSSFSVIQVEGMLEWIKQVEDNAKNEPDFDMLAGLISKIRKKYMFAEAALKERFVEKTNII